MAKTVTGSTAQLIYNPAAQPAGAVVQIIAQSGGTHYIGQSGVTSSTGVPMNAGDTIKLSAPSVPLYAINVASGTLEVLVGR